MKKQVYVAVDIGATKMKMVSASFEKGRLQIQDIYSVSNHPVLKNGGEYVDIGYLLAEIKRGLQQFSQHSDCICLGIDTYGNGYGILNTHGDLIQEPHYYRDPRIDHIMEAVHQHYTNRQLYEQTGNFPVKTRGLFHLYQDVQDGSKGILEGSSLLPFSNLLEYLITGEKGVERSIASVLYLLDQRGDNWNFETFKTLGIPHQIFGPLCEPGVLRGRTSPAFAANEKLRGIPVVSVLGHDTESALLAAPKLDDKKVFVSLGTSFIFGCRVENPVVNDHTYNHHFKNMRGAFGSYSLCKDFPGFWILERCMEQWRQDIPHLDYDTVCREAKEAGRSKTFINISDDRFRVSSGNLERLIFDYCMETGQQAVTGVGAVSRCLFESYALYLKWNLEKLQEITGVVYDGLTAVNGGVKNHFLMQLFADVLGIPVIGGSPLASACGNLLMQLYANENMDSKEKLGEVMKNSWTPQIYKGTDSDYWRQRLEQLKRRDVLKEDVC